MSSLKRRCAWWLLVVLGVTLLGLPVACDNGSSEDPPVPEDTTDTTGDETPVPDPPDPPEPPPEGTGSDFVDNTYYGMLRGTEAGDEAFSLRLDQNQWLVYGPYTSVRYTGQADGTFTWPDIAFTVDMVPAQAGLPAKEVRFTGLVDRTGNAMSGTWTALSGVAGSGAWDASTTGP